MRLTNSLRRKVKGTTNDLILVAGVIGVPAVIIGLFVLLIASIALHHN